MSHKFVAFPSSSCLSLLNCRTDEGAHSSWFVIPANRGISAYPGRLFPSSSMYNPSLFPLRSKDLTFEPLTIPSAITCPLREVRSQYAKLKVETLVLFLRPAARCSIPASPTWLKSNVSDRNGTFALRLSSSSSHPCRAMPQSTSSRCSKPSHTSGLGSFIPNSNNPFSPSSSTGECQKHMLLIRQWSGQSSFSDLPTCLIATGLRLSNSLLPSSFTSPANTSFIVSLASSGPFGRAHP
mmetsp:Transcript_5951/g.13759  ORF Transcript_5951/g.13759 Transcript_5951/m.13759 type:complete len:239 (-) Transcript_5951:148-864(-)